MVLPSSTDLPHYCSGGTAHPLGGRFSVTRIIISPCCVCNKYELQQPVAQHLPPKPLVPATNRFICSCMSSMLIKVYKTNAYTESVNSGGVMSVTALRTITFLAFYLPSLIHICRLPFTPSYLVLHFLLSVSSFLLFILLILCYLLFCLPS